MSKRPLWKTKTLYVSLLTIATGIVMGIFDGWQQAMPYILGGLGAITGRDALSKIE